MNFYSVAKIGIFSKIKIKKTAHERFFINYELFTMKYELFMKSVVFTRIVCYATKFFFDTEKLVILANTVCA